MLEKIFQSVENSRSRKNLISADPKPESRVEIESSSPGRSCDRCGSKSFWIAKRSNALRCERCDPPSSESIVASRSGDPGIAIERRSTEISDRDIRSILGQSWGPFVVAYSRPVCSCGCDWANESGTMEKIIRTCVVCKNEIE